MAALGILKTQLAPVPPLQNQLISSKKSPLFLVPRCTFSEGASDSQSAQIGFHAGQK